jgi:phytoene dehydrogenase-like protein
MILCSPFFFQVYMFAEWYKPGCCLEYPLHGTGALVDALVRGMKKFGGQLSLGSHVENIVVENDRATGVKLRSGQVSNLREFEVYLNGIVCTLISLVEEHL